MSRRIVGKAASYRGLVAVLRALFEAKQITREALDEQCGLTARHSSKLLTNPPLKNFGSTSLTLLLQGFDLELWVVQRSDAIDSVPKSERPRQPRERT